MYMQSLAEVPFHLAELGKVSDRIGAREADEFAREGVGLSRLMLAVVHGSQLVSVPSAKVVGDWEAKGLRLMREMQRVDPQWLREWDGPVRNRVTGKGGR